jgi:zinc protease
MNVRIRVGVATLLSVIVLGLCLVRAQELPNPALSTPLDQPVPLDSRITIGYMANGLRYYIRTNPLPSRRAELRLCVNVGSVLEDDDQIGLAHFVEHMAFNGSEHFAKQDLIKFMESIGMRLGPGVNANTSFDQTVYQLHVPTDNPEAMNKAFLFLSDVAHSLSFDPEAIDKERGVIVEEWRQGRGADARMQDQQFPVLLARSRYAQRVPIGTMESIKTFNPDALKRFYTDWYRPDLMAVIAVGDFDKAQVEAMIKERFGPIPGRVRPRERPTYDVPEHSDTLYAVSTDAEATTTTVGVYNMLPVQDQTTVRAYRQQLVERLYTQMMNARLAELSMAANPPFLQAETQRGLFVRTKEAASLMALVNDEGIERGLDALVTESVRAARFGFTAVELEREKREMMRFYEGAFAERNREESADLAAEYIRNFTQKEPIPGITYEYGLVRRFIPEVSLEEINAVAKDWAGGSRVVLVNAPKRPDLPVPDGARLAAVMAAAMKNDITPHVDVAGGQSLLDQPPKPGTIVKTVTRLDLGLVEWELSNGARVVLKPTTVKQDEIVFRAVSPGGTSLASDEDLVPAVTAGQVIDAGGVGKFNPIQLRNILAGEAAAVSAFINDTDEGLSGGASPKDLETMFQLIYLSMTEPRADSTVFSNMTAQMRAMLRDREASPEWAFRTTLQSVLTQDNPRGRPLTPKTVDQMNLQKSLAFYSDRFADASDFTFVFTGNFDLGTIRPLVEKYIASLPSLRRHETWRNVGIEPPRGVVEKVVRKGIEPKSQAAIVFTGQAEFDSAHEVALQALSIVLETRLRESLREQLSGSYDVEVWANADKIPQPQYSVTINFGCDPERTEELVKALFRAIETLKTKGPSAGEVSDAREALLRQHESALAQNARLAAEIADRYELGEDVQEFFDLPKEYMGLTAASVHDAAQRYLDTANYVRVTLYPETAPAKVGEWHDGATWGLAAMK